MSVLGGKIVRARKRNETREIPLSTSLVSIELVMKRVLPIERQCAEWGIRCLKGPFGSLIQPLSAAANRFSRRPRVCMHLRNVRRRFVRLIQITTMYALL